MAVLFKPPPSTEYMLHVAAEWAAAHMQAKVAVSVEHWDGTYSRMTVDMLPPKPATPPPPITQKEE